MSLVGKIKDALYAVAHRSEISAINEFKRPFIERETARRQSDPACLMNFEARVYSENGEDGVIAELFRRIGATNRQFVEFGAGTGKQNNTRLLLERQSWSGLWIEGKASRAAKAIQLFTHLPVAVVASLVTQENIRGHLERAGIGSGFDLLSIDIDGNDYWLWKALGELKPRVVVIEYNSFFLPGEEWVMPYDPSFSWDATNFFGASLASLARLGIELGYQLVGCESRGVNAFFVRKDLTEGAFGVVADPVEHHYVSPKYKENYFGHPPSPKLAHVMKQRLESRRQRAVNGR